MSKITDIQPQKNNKNRVNVYVDGQYTLALELLTVVKLGLKIGNEVTEETLREASLDTEKSVALERAMNYIARGRRTSAQMRKYLVGKQYSDDVVDYVMDKMKYYGYVDDQAYAAAYVEQNMSTKGARRLKQELIQRGISAEHAEAYAEQDDELSRQNADRLAQKYMRGKTGDIKTLVRLQRYLVSRGYDYDTVNEIARRYKSADQPDMDD